MTEEFIELLLGCMPRHASFAKKCGFGIGGHGWLISQFLSPSLNTRKDKWGGAPIEKPARLAFRSAMPSSSVYFS
jgi:2,4-dienoyl-CoA reductase-like NADH-dependent reductase (Old Yellow Enzyme family)